MNQQNLTSVNASRRLLLRNAGAFGLLGGAAAPLLLNLTAAGSALAQSAGDYKALVCLFFFGGNDAYNMVLPTDAASWAPYASLRNQAPDSIALMAPGTAPVPGAAAASPARLGGVLPIAPLNTQGRTFALHPLMGTLQTMFNNDKRLAILPSIGPLIVPTTKAQLSLSSHPRPPRLGSHNDQQNTWQALAPEGATKGWGGRMADMLAAGNGQPIFSAVSAAGNAVWLAGNNVRSYQVNTGGAIRLAADSTGKLFGSTAAADALNRIVSGARSTHLLEADVATIAQRSVEAEVALRTALKVPSDAAFGTLPATGAYNVNTDPKMLYDNPLTGVKTFNALAQQFQVVARLIEAAQSGAVSVKRQVFFVSVGGFDTHDFQNRNQGDLMARVAHALRYFDTSLGAMGALNKVTTFTASDFGRTFTSNGDGTDHGWGSHHLVMGGAVKGGDLYGRFPTLGLKNTANNNFDSSPDMLGNGSMLPQTAVDQLGATLGKWFGLSDAQLLDVFPNIASFDASKRDLGFMA